MRVPLFLAAALVAAPAVAADAPYYGPMRHWHGIGIAYQYGYRDRVEADGTWRIEANVRSGEALAVAMYRAAERARAEGYPFVQFLRATGSRGPGLGSATLWVRPARDPAQPADCRARAAGGCYTADAAELLRRLGGPGGAQPGVRLADARDRYGREVFYGSGFGIGDARLTPARAPLPAAVAPAPARKAVAEPSDAERYRAALRAAEPR